MSRKPKENKAAAPEAPEVENTTVADEKGAPEAVITESIPPAPVMDPMQGDKTPAYVEWMFKYNPAEAAKKYNGRVVGQ